MSAQADMLAHIEKLGALYLGREVGTGAPYLLPSRDLVTHAVAVGMTGSGKTGLCTALLEECAIDGIPAIVIDPKGDLSNLALRFPNLAPSDFRPYVDEAEAATNGMTADGFAEKLAAEWRSGLAATLQDPQRIQRFVDAADVALYTPGSTAARPLSLLRGLHVQEAVRQDPELLAEHVMANAAALLSIAGVDVESTSAPALVFVAKLLESAALEDRELSLPALVQQITKPPFQTVGVLDVDTFFPVKERTAVALAFNAVLASPAFAAWTRGEPLDVQALLWGSGGRPRLSVLSIAHLDDHARMFFVTTLLQEVIAWIRRQPGTSSLRAVLFMDEVLGFLPPVANPPSKRPLLTLLKQARAQGLGVVLATQNPVDLDYKALANTGVWLLGRLQTERDKARLLDGLEGAAAGVSRADLDAKLSSLEKRQFLVHNVRAPAPTVIESRWTLSFLRGPLTRAQLAALENAAPAGGAAPEAPRARAVETAANDTAAATAGLAGGAAVRPVVPAGIVERFAPRDGAPSGDRLEPHVLATARVHYTDKKLGLDLWRTVTLLDEMRDDRPLFDQATRVELASLELLETPPEGASFAPLPARVTAKGAPASWRKACADALYREHPLELLACPALKVVAAPDEDEVAARARIDVARREARDRGLEQIKERFGKKVAALERAFERANERVAREEQQARSATIDTAMSVGSAVFGALFGRKTFSASNVSRAARSARTAARMSDQSSDVDRAVEARDEAQAKMRAVEEELDAESRALELRLEQQVVEKIRIAPRKADTVVEQVVLVWR